MHRFKLTVPYFTALLFSSVALVQAEESCPNPEGFALNGDALDRAMAQHAQWVRDSRRGARAILCRLEAAALDLKALDLRGSDLRMAQMPRADFSGARLDGALMAFSDLRQASVRGASLHKTNFDGAMLDDADLSDTKGVKISLRKANLVNADLSNSHFPGADLGQSSSTRARFDGTNLRGATLWKSNLAGASFSGANLSGVNIRGANLVDVNLEGAVVSKADFAQATVTRVDARGVDFAGVLNLTDAQRRHFSAKASGPGTAARAAAPAPAPATVSVPVPVVAPGVANAENRGSASRPAGANGRYQVQLGSYRNVKIAKAVVKRIGRQHETLLKGIGLELKPIRGENGTWHRLRTGYLPTRGSAKQLCDTLKAGAPSLGCIVVK